MKRALSVLVALLLTAAFFGCGNSGKPPAPDPKEVLELDTAALGKISLIGIDSNTRYSVMLYSSFEENAGYGESEADDYRCFISLFDLEKNAEIKRIELESKDIDAYDIEISDGGITLYKASDEKLLYDFSLENPVRSAHKFGNYFEQAESIPSINAEEFNCNNGYAVSNDFRKTQLLVFYDRPETLYLLKNNIYYEYTHSSGHQILVIDNSGNEAQSYKSVARIFDFDTRAEINSFTVPNESEYNNIQFTKLNAECATVSTLTDDGAFDKAYVWRYTLNPKNSPFEEDFCQATDSDELQNEIDRTCARIKENLGVSLICAPELSFINEAHPTSNSVPLINFYRSALDLEFYLSVLPKELYQEITCSDLENPLSSFEEFVIYLVGDFLEDGIEAFASNIGCDETDNRLILYAVFSCADLTQKTFFHELMHTLEYRIWNYEENFSSSWATLNPKDFSYTADYGSVFYDESYADRQDYFARDYGMMNELEDRATCFEELCDSMLTASCWWLDKAPLVAKQKYLQQTLQKSFPSLRETDFFHSFS